MPCPADAVLFDLDGTLTDRRQTLFAFAQRFLDDFPHVRIDRDGPVRPARLTELIIEADGNGRRSRTAVLDDVHRALRGEGVPSAQRFRRYWRKVFPDCTRPAPGLVKTLQSLALRGIPLGLVTNGGAVSQRRKIEVLGIEPFLRVMLISGELGFRKPDLRIFRRAVAALGTLPQRTLFVGDDPILDVRGAASAGLVPVWMQNGSAWPSRLVPPHLQIAHLCELPRLMRCCHDRG